MVLHFALNKNIHRFIRRDAGNPFFRFPPSSLTDKRIGSFAPVLRCIILVMRCPHPCAFFHNATPPILHPLHPLCPHPLAHSAHNSPTISSFSTIFPSPIQLENLMNAALLAGIGGFKKDNLTAARMFFFVFKRRMIHLLDVFGTSSHRNFSHLGPCPIILATSILLHHVFDARDSSAESFIGRYDASLLGRWVSPNRTTLTTSTSAAPLLPQCVPSHNSYCTIASPTSPTTYQPQLRCKLVPRIKCAHHHMTTTWIPQPQIGDMNGSMAHHTFN